MTYYIYDTIYQIYDTTYYIYDTTYQIYDTTYFIYDTTYYIYDDTKLFMMQSPGQPLLEGNSVNNRMQGLNPDAESSIYGQHFITDLVTEGVNNNYADILEILSWIWLLNIITIVYGFGLKVAICIVKS